MLVNEESKTVSVSRDRKGTSDFTFSNGAVLGPQSTQQLVYSHCNSLISDVLDGVDVAVLAYGQTSSGKTHSMYGKGWEQEEGGAPDTAIPEADLGVVPRSVADLFAALDARSAASQDFDFSVTCQLLQIYNEKIYDLLQDKKRENPLVLRESGRHGASGASNNNSVHVSGSSVYRVHSQEDVGVLLRKGLRNRVIRATDFNAESSRSHTILQLFVSVEEPDEQGLLVLRRSTFSLVDLAGSEKWLVGDNLQSSKGASGNGVGGAGGGIEVAQKEMVNINSSLHVLGKVVSALLEHNRRHIPFRDSVLTRLLQDALGGSGRTVLIATLREDSEFREESYSTLQFANRASRIRMTVQPSAGVAEGITLDAAKKQIRMLRTRLQDLSTQQTCSSCDEIRALLQALLAENTALREQLVDNGIETNSPSVAVSVQQALASINPSSSPVRMALMPPPSSPVTYGAPPFPGAAGVQDSRSRQRSSAASPQTLRRSQSSTSASVSSTSGSPLRSGRSAHDSVVDAVVEATMSASAKKRTLKARLGAALGFSGQRARRPKRDSSTDAAIERMRVADGTVRQGTGGGVERPSRRSASPSGRPKRSAPGSAGQASSQLSAPQSQRQQQPAPMLLQVESAPSPMRRLTYPLAKLSEDPDEDRPSPTVPRHSPDAPPRHPRATHDRVSPAQSPQRSPSKQASGGVFGSGSPAARSAKQALEMARRALGMAFEPVPDFADIVAADPEPEPVPVPEPQGLAKEENESGGVVSPSRGQKKHPSPIVRAPIEQQSSGAEEEEEADGAEADGDLRDDNSLQSLGSLGSLGSLAREGSFFEAGEGEDNGSVVLQGSWIDPDATAPSPANRSMGAAAGYDPAASFASQDMREVDAEIQTTMALLSSAASSGANVVPAASSDTRAKQSFRSQVLDARDERLRLQGQLHSVAANVATMTNPDPAPTPVPAPVPGHATLAGPVDPDAPCPRHGLEQCILCIMFGNNGEKQVVTSTSSFSAASIAPTTSYAAAPAPVQAAPFAGHGYSMSSSSSSNPSAPNSLGFSSRSSFAPFQPPVRPPSTGMKCTMHEVTDCLLCSLNSSPQRRAAPPPLSSTTSSSYLPSYQQPLPQQQFSHFVPSSYPSGSSTYSAVSSYAQQAQQQMQQQMLQVQQQYRQSQPQSLAPEDDDEGDEAEAPTMTLHSKSALTYRKDAPRGPVGRDQSGAAMSAPPDTLRARGQASAISYEDPTDEPEAQAPGNGPSTHLAGAASVALRRQQQQQQQQQQQEWTTAPTQPLNPVRVPKKQDGRKKKKTSKAASVVAAAQGRPSPYATMMF